MGLLSTVRGAVAIANKLTADLQAQVLHEAFISETTKGDRTYATGVLRPAIVQMKAQSVVSSSGELTFSKASIVVLDASVIITDDDRFTLPDGSSGPIVLRAGFIDRITGQPILTQVYLG